MLTLPRVTEILAFFHAYDAYPVVHQQYYFNRGTWCGDWCDAIALKGALAYTHDAHAYGEIWREKPLSPGNMERWGLYVQSFKKLVASDSFGRQFFRCLDVQQEVINEVEGYVGHYDQRWEMTNGREAIIDTKASIMIPKATGIQLAFYDLALAAGATERKPRRRFAIRLCSDGSPAFLLEYTDSRDYDTVRLLARAYHRAKEFAHV